MLLKNLNKKQGLCNGTRLVVEVLKQSLLLQRLTPFRGRKDSFYLPKMWLRSDDVLLTGSVQRFQFPVTLAFSMSINKSQGQGFGHVGVYLARQYLSHVQFYVALSRVTLGRNLHILVVMGPRQGPLSAFFGGRNAIHNTFTRNIVIRAILQ